MPMSELELPTGPRVMYVCELCADEGSEDCAYYDPAEVRRAPDGKWLCKNCWDGAGWNYVNLIDPEAMPLSFRELPPAPDMAAEIERLRNSVADANDAAEHWKAERKLRERAYDNVGREEDLLREIERLRTALATARADALEEAATELTVNWGHKATPEMAAAIRALAQPAASSERATS